MLLGVTSVSLLCCVVVLLCCVFLAVLDVSSHCNVAVGVCWVQDKDS